jgi:flagella basal body P-ring formation protein FlgA
MVSVFYVTKTVPEGNLVYEDMVVKKLVARKDAPADTLCIPDGVVSQRASHQLNKGTLIMMSDIKADLDVPQLSVDFFPY